MQRKIYFTSIIVILGLFSFLLNDKLSAVVNCTGNLEGIEVVRFQSEPNNPSIGDEVRVTIELRNTSNNAINLAFIRVTDEMEVGVGEWEVGGARRRKGLIAEFMNISIDGQGSFIQTLPSYIISRSGQHEISMDISDGGQRSKRCYAPSFYVPPRQDPRCTTDDIQVLELKTFSASPLSPRVGDPVTVTIELQNISGQEKRIQTLRLTDEMEVGVGEWEVGGARQRKGLICELRNPASLAPNQTFSHTATFTPTIDGNHEISTDIIDEANRLKRCYITLGVRSGPQTSQKEFQLQRIDKKKFRFDKKYQSNR